ncbi:MAG: preprotein translocase subunit YajC [Rhodanobacteraceae bacterium]
MDFLISSAHAQTAGSGAASSAGGFGMMNILFLVVLFGVFYFMLIRPQQKRMKEHKAMLGQLARGDEVVTNGGMAGRVDDIGEHFITVEVADKVKLKVQKQSISQVLPKGTLKSS